MSLSPDGNYLLTNAMDNTLRAWDVRPYAPADRCVKVFTGHQHTFERLLLRCSWSPDGKRVAAGSADRIVYVWEADSLQLAYALPGHKGSVNEVVFHPKVRAGGVGFWGGCGADWGDGRECLCLQTAVRYLKGFADTPPCLPPTQTTNQPRAGADCGLGQQRPHHLFGRDLTRVMTLGRSRGRMDEECVASSTVNR